MNNTSETSLQFHKITTRKEAEDFVYASYLRAASHQDYAAKDARKRHLPASLSPEAREKAPFPT